MAGRLTGGRTTAGTSVLVQAARMYYQQGLTQPAIAERLHVSQSRVSRWLKEANRLGIVRTTVLAPDGVHPELEDELMSRYHLDQVIVVDADGSEQDVNAALGAAGASFLEATLAADDRVGISSWSSTIQAAVEAMTPLKGQRAATVVQIMGGMGRPEVQFVATQTTDRLARLTGAEPMYLLTPGLAASPGAREAFFADPTVSAVAQEWKRLTMLFLGVGSTEPSGLLRISGNAVPDEQVQALTGIGAVGEVTMRFIDADGRLVASDIDDRVMGIDEEDLRRTPRRVGVAGGPRKVAAIRAAALGGWINILITDVATARRLAVATG